MKLENPTPIISTGDLTRNLVADGILRKAGPHRKLNVVRSSHEVFANAHYSAIPNGIVIVEGEQGPMIVSSIGQNGPVYYVRGFPALIDGAHVQQFRRSNSANWYKIDPKDPRNKRKNDGMQFNITEENPPPTDNYAVDDSQSGAEKYLHIRIKWTRGGVADEIKHASKPRKSEFERLGNQIESVLNGDIELEKDIAVDFALALILMKSEARSRNDYGFPKVKNYKEAVAHFASLYSYSKEEIESIEKLYSRINKTIDGYSSLLGDIDLTFDPINQTTLIGDVVIQKYATWANIVNSVGRRYNSSVPAQVTCDPEFIRAKFYKIPGQDEDYYTLAQAIDLEKRVDSRMLNYLIDKEMKEFEQEWQRVATMRSTLKGRLKLFWETKNFKDLLPW